MLNNKGFTLIEMILILAIVCMLTAIFSIKLTSYNAATNLEVVKLKQTIIKSKLDSTYFAKKNNVSIQDNHIVVNLKDEAINKLSCRNTKFSYNLRGHINKPVKLECSGYNNLYNFNLSIGTGILYE
ncbi:MAG: type II secretion system protein [Erysipelotrichaceae bacterium]